MEHVRVKAAQPDALDARHPGGLFHQLHQRGAGVGAVAGQADGSKHHFFIPGLRQPPQFFQNTFLAAAAHRAAGAGNDAVGALPSAAVLHLHKGAGMLGKPVHGQFLKLLALVMGADVHHTGLLAVQHLPHILQNGPAAAAAGHYIRLCNGGGLLREGLWITPGQHRHRAGVFPLGAAQPFAAFLVSEVGHGTAVHHVHIRRFTAGHHRVAAVLKQLGQRAGLVLIHLAAKGIKGHTHSFHSFS